MISKFLLDERFDEWISHWLMYQAIGVDEFVIKDSGKSGSDRIYQALKIIEERKGVKL